ncbi:MAG: beta-propeller fold lactonase family protein [Buchnera aphidicola (Chaetogeoica yunlongensis)]
MKQIIYISLATTKEIEVWKLHDDFSLTLLQKISLPGEPQPILILKSKKLLYVGLRPNFGIYSYTIQSNGTLKEQSSAILPGSPNHFEIDITEKFLFSSSYHFNCISVTPIDFSGNPQPFIQVINNIHGCHASKINDQNNTLFVSSLHKNRIYIFDFIKKGILLTNKYNFVITHANFGPRNLEFYKHKNWLFSINELNGSIDIWFFNQQKKTIELMKNINILSDKNTKKAWSSDLSLSSCKKYLYASDRTENTISIIKINKDIKKVKKINTVKTELKQPRTFHINSTGENLFIIGEKSHNFSIYKISQATGCLELKNTQSTIGLRPVWISSIIL